MNSACSTNLKSVLVESSRECVSSEFSRIISTFHSVLFRCGKYKTKDGSLKPVILSVYLVE